MRIIKTMYKIGTGICMVYAIGFSTKGLIVLAKEGISCISSAVSK